MQLIIEAALKEEPPPSVREVARRLGYQGIIPFKRRFPQHYDEVLLRVSEFGRLKYEEVYSKLRMALEETPPPPLSELRSRFRHYIVEEYSKLQTDFKRRIVARYNKFKKARRNKATRMLETALTETPTPSLSTIARRLQFLTASGLTRAFPDLCRQIVARRRENTISAHEFIRKELKAALKEVPPPSVSEMSRRLNFELSTLYHNCPEECYALAAKYAQYRHSIVIKREKQRQREVRRIIIRLHRKGEYPSEARVEKLLNSPLALRNKSLKEVFRSVKRELNLM